MLTRPAMARDEHHVRLRLRVIVQPDRIAGREEIPPTRLLHKTLIQPFNGLRVANTYWRHDDDFSVEQLHPIFRPEDPQLAESMKLLDRKPIRLRRRRYGYGAAHREQ